MQGMVFMIMKQYQDDSSDLEGLEHSRIGGTCARLPGLLDLRKRDAYSSILVMLVIQNVHFN